MYAPDWYRTVVDVEAAWCRRCGWAGDVEGVHDRWDRVTTWSCPTCGHEEKEEMR